MTFASATPSQGSYDSTTGEWSVGALANGSTATLTIVAEATGAVGTAQENTVEVTASDVDDPDSTPGDGARGADDFDSTVVTITEPNQADVSITKVVDEDAPAPGETVTYTITATNDGPQTTDLTVQEGLPAGLSTQSVTPSAGLYDPPSEQWTVTLAPGQTETLTVVAEVTGSPGDEITNTVSVADSSVPDPTTDDQTDDATVVVTAADLGIAKTVNTSTATVGDQVTFTVTLTNAGPSPATGVTVEDQLPAGLSLVSNTTTTGFYDASTGIWTLPDIGAGNSETLTLVAETTTAGTFENVAAINASDQFDQDTTNDSDGATVEVVDQTADLGVDKTVDDQTPQRGDTVNFTLSVTNSGPNDATGVTLDDPLPAGLTFVSASGDGSYDAATGVWTVGTVPAGTTQTITLTARVDTDEAVTNTLTVNATDQGDPVVENDSASVQVVPIGNADLSLSKTVNVTSVNDGEDLQFNLTVRNDGPSPATVVVNDSVPAALTTLSSSATQGSYDQTTRSWNVGALAPGENATLTIVARAALPEGGDVANVAEVALSNQSDPDSTPGNNDPGEDDYATATVRVNGSETAPTTDLELNKTVADSSAGVCGRTTYTVTVTNTGTNNATNVTVLDDTPAGVEFVGATADQGSYDLGTGLWAVGTVEPGETVTLTIDVRVVGAEGTSQVNTAQVQTVDQDDPDSAPGNNDAGEDDQDSAPITVTGGQGGFISGRVSDQNNNDVPGAVVVVTDSDTGVVVATTTADSEGDYTVEVPPGVYDVQVTRAGFTSVGRTDVSVPCNRTASVNLVIERDLVATFIEVTPKSATEQVGDTITYTVTVRDQDGNPLPGVDVTAVDDDPDVTFVGGNVSTTDQNGQTTFTVTSTTIASATLTFEAQSGSRPSTTATAAFIQNGEAEIDGVVLSAATTDPVVDASVWAIPSPLFDDNTVRNRLSLNDSPSGVSLTAATETLSAINDSDNTVFVRLVDADTGAVLDVDEYRVQTTNTENTSIRVLDALNTTNESVGQGFAVLYRGTDLANATVAFTHTRLAPEDYYIEVSNTAPRNSDIDEVGDAANAPENFTQVGSVYSPTRDLRLAATKARANVTGANLVDAPGFVNSYGVDTGGTNVNGQFKLNKLASNFQAGEGYVIVATAPGLDVEFGDVFVREDGAEFDDSEVQGLNLEPVPVEAERVDLTQVGTHPPLDETAGVPDPDRITPFPEQGQTQDDDDFQQVPRDGTVDVLRVETTTDDGTPVNSTAVIDFREYDGNIEGEFVGVLGGTNVSGGEPGSDTVTVSTGNDGVATVLFESDENADSVSVDKTATLANDASAVDSSNATFVGVIDLETASISGIVTDTDDTPLPNSAAWARSFVWESRNLSDTSFRVTIEPVTPAGVGPGDTAYGDEVDELSDDFNVSVYRDVDDDGDLEFVGSEITTAGDLRSYQFDAFPSVSTETSFRLYDRADDSSDASYTLEPVPAVNDVQDSTKYRVRAVKFDEPNKGSPSNDGLAEVFPQTTDDANLVIPIQFEPASVVLNDQTSDGSSAEVASYDLGSAGEFVSVWTFTNGSPQEFLGSVEPGETTGGPLTIDFEQNLSEDTTVVAAIHDGSPRSADTVIQADTAELTITGGQDDLAAQYDSNDDGTIQSGEVLAVIAAFNDGDIEDSQVVLAVIDEFNGDQQWADV